MADRLNPRSQQRSTHCAPCTGGTRWESLPALARLRATWHPAGAMLTAFVLGRAAWMLGWHRLALRQINAPNSLNTPTRSEPRSTSTRAGRHDAERALICLAVDAVNSDCSLHTTIALPVLAITCPATMQLT